MLLLLLQLTLLLAGAAGLTLTGDEVYVFDGGGARDGAGNEPTALRLAVRDVLRDVYLVLGRRPLVLPAPPAPGALPPNTTLVFFGSSASPWLATLFPSVPGSCWGGWEAHCVLGPLAAGGGAGYANVIVATGAGTRGPIYAAYSFSEAVLGVNPWKHFTDDSPQYAAPLELANDFALAIAPPQFKYRGIFINDEDLLALQFPDPLGLAAIDLRAYDRLLETLLRLKGNLMVPATNPFPDQQVNALCGRRGVVLSFHHYDLVGGDVFSWPLPSTDWDYAKDPGTMAAMWRAAITAQKDSPEVIWSTGLRGLNDMSYKCGSPAQCGRLISEAMGNQTAWIRAVQPNATVILYLWQELLELLAGGYLVLPAETQIVFTDAGSGFIRVDSNWTTYCSGVYYHTAMYEGIANQLTEMVPVDRIVAQLTPVVQQSKATNIIIDNVSDLKPVPMTTEAVLRFAWDPKPFLSAPTPMAAARAFYTQWGARQHGMAPTDPAAAAFSALWADLFAIPYLQSGVSDNFFGTEGFGIAHAAAQGIARSSSVPADALSRARAAVNRLTNNTDASGASVVNATAALLARAEELEQAIPAPRRGFFRSHTLLQTRIAAGGSAMLVGVAASLEAAEGGDWAGAQAAATAACASGASVLAGFRDAEASSNPGMWAGLYAGDYLTNMQGAWDACRQLEAACAAPGKSALPPIDTENLWYTWDFAWQQNPTVAPRYPLSQALDPNTAFATTPRINCVFADVDAGLCAPNPDGGVWAAGKGGRITLQVMTSPTAAVGGSGLTLRYTLDGSVPTAASQAYAPGGLALDALAGGGRGVNVTAAVFDGSVRVGGARTTQWRAL